MHTIERDKGMGCAVCGYDCGWSRYWWVLNVRFWWHEVLGGKSHREAAKAWEVENAWMFQ